MEDFVEEQGLKEEQEPLFLYEEGDAALAKTLVNEAAYLGKRLTTDARVPGRIGREEFYDFWKNELKASPFVLDTLRRGYGFPFKQRPPASMVANNR